jgi:hypothetical protein
MKLSPSFPVKLSPSLEKILSPAYRCTEFDRACRGEMRWRPKEGHVPRGFLGACGEAAEVELILVFAEPGDPHAEEDYDEAYEKDRSGRIVLDRVYKYATHAVEIGHDQFHRSLRYVLDMCWPNTSFERQLRKVWLTDTILCSAPSEGGGVSRSAVGACGRGYLLDQLALFPKALVVAVGSKAQQRLRLLNKREGTDFIHVQSTAPPGCNYRGSRESWERIPIELRRRRDA